MFNTCQSRGYVLDLYLIHTYSIIDCKIDILTINIFHFEFFYEKYAKHCKLTTIHI